MKYVLLGIYGVIICAAVIAIIKIRERKVFTGSALDEEHNSDFIDDLASYRRRHLNAQPWGMKYETYVAVSTVCAIVFAAAAYLAWGVAYAAVAAVVGALVPEIVVQVQSASQRQKFEERYARALRQLSAALKSGMSVPQAVDDVCRSPFIHDDVKGEFQKLNADLQLGIPAEEAFRRFHERVRLADAEDVAIAIQMQTKVGGREGEAIEAIAHNIADRMALRKEINSMFAGSSVTVAVLDVLPFGVIAILFIGARTFMSVYFSSAGMLALLIAMLVLMGVGSVVTHRLVSKMKRGCGV